MSMVSHHYTYHRRQVEKYYLLWRENNANFKRCKFHKRTIRDLPAHKKALILSLFSLSRGDHWEIQLAFMT